MRRYRSWAVFAVLAVGMVWLLFRPNGCSSQRIEIVAVRESSGYVFEFGDRRAIDSLSIFEISGAERRLVCSIQSDRRSSPLVGRWVYASVPPGYQKEGCASLDPGSYYLEAFGAGLGRLFFRIQPDGSVAL
jgi:hypothetical protein